MRVCFVVTLLTVALCCAAYDSGESTCSGTGRWRVDCNWCHCDRGTPACTEKFCSGLPEPGPSCEGTVSWKPDCNICTCQNGHAICTLIACGPGHYPGCSTPPKICLQGFDSGPCEALEYRWGFNSATGQCEEFGYGGCLGNENNFKTREECERVCDDDDDDCDDD